MKVYRLLLTLHVLGASFIFDSCSKDDPAIPDILIVTDRLDGKFYQVNTSTGALTELGQAKLSGVGLAEIRGVVYNQSDNKVYATSTNDGSGKLYSIDPSTMVATLINGNTSDFWYGLPSIKVTADGKLICTAWHKTASSVGNGPGLQKFNLDGTIASTILFATTDPNGIDMCCGFGMEFGDNTSELLITSAENGIEIFSSDLSGNLTLSNSITPEGFEAGTDTFDYVIRHIVRMSGKIYALVFAWDDTTADYGHMYLAELNLTTNKVVKIAKISDDIDVQYQGLAVIPGNLF